jgi:uncharacterized membrane protein
MKTQLSKLFERLRSSYWFLPSLMAVSALLLSYGMIQLDDMYRFEMKRSFWLYTGHAGGAMEVLSTIASATITIASLTFSVTIVALTLAASQYGPRLLYNFMRDRSNQTVLGIFIAAFLYSLMVLRSIQGDGATFVPQLSITMALVLALCGIGALIYFIHHTAETIQADTLIATVSQELRGSVHATFPPVEKEADYQREVGQANPLWNRLQGDSHKVRARTSGFLQAIDVDALKRVATERDLIMRVFKRPGELVIHEAELLAIHPAARADPALAQVCREAFVLGSRRTLIQDAELPFQQLVEMAVRGLSPGVYDPYTALRCIGRIADGLVLVMGRAEPSQVRCDDDGNVRLLLPVASFATIADASFVDLRAYGATNTLVMEKLIGTLGDLVRCARTDGQRQVLLRHARLIHEAAAAHAGEAAARGSLDRAYAELMTASATGTNRVLETPPASRTH